MPRNGLGTYQLPAGNPVVTGTPISSTTQNTTMTDIANALTTSVSTDGQTPMTANLPMGGNKITNMAAGQANGDAIRFEQFIALSGLNYGPTDPSTLPGGAQPFSFWADTSVTPNLLRQRNGANTAWIKQGDLTRPSFGLIGPTFSAYQNLAQALAASTNNKVQFQQKDYDSDNSFDSGTNYRFNPQVQGYYLITGACYISTTTGLIVSVAKNGARLKDGGSGNTQFSVGVAAAVYLNGTTDYVEIFVNPGVACNTVAGQNATYFQGTFLRGS